MTALLAHTAASAGDDPTGSPLYRLLPEHLPGLAGVILVPLAAWLVHRRASAGSRAAVALRDGYGSLSVDRRFLVWLLAASAAIHLALPLGEPGPIAPLFVADAAALLVVTRRLLLGKRWRLPACLVLLASILAYAAVLVGGEAPDQAGLLTKLVELTALAIALTPERESATRRLAASSAVVVLVVVTGLAAWAGAFAAAEVGRNGHAHAAMPGTVMAAAPDREPTADEREAADLLHRQTVAALAPYRDPALAARDGYAVDGLGGRDFHAANPTYADDGRILDPTRPEQLVYAESNRGPVLLGAVFEMPGTGEAGPAIGGPLTVWHAHENVCFSLAPPAFSGLVSPFGGCPFASISLPITAEMIHVWVVPGAPSRFGDLDDAWRQRYLDGLSSS